MAELIGIVAGVLGIIQFGLTNIPEPEDNKAVLNIGVGLDGSSKTDGGATLDNAGGDLPDVRLWNENTEFINMAVDPGSVDSGTFAKVTVDQGDNGEQATYALLSANNDAICIAFASLKWPESAGGYHYGWIGDWGAECGAPFFYSGLFVNGDNYAPSCTWIDGDGDQPTTGLSFHMPSFTTSGDAVPEYNVTDYCNSPSTFTIHNEDDPSAIALGDPLSSSSSTKRSVSEPVKPHVASSKKFKGRLVVSKDAKNHGTDYLCNMPNSAGPDFLNIAEGKFCDMQTKTLYPVCTKKVKTDCFDTDSHQLVKKGVKGVQSRSTPYHRVEDWTPNQP